MNSLKGKEIDEYFRQELTRQEQPFEEYHWLVLEKRLKKNRRNRVIGWFISSGLAAMLLLALGISFLVNQKAETPVQARKSAAKDQPAKTPDLRSPVTGVPAPSEAPLASARRPAVRAHVPSGSAARNAEPGTAVGESEPEQLAAAPLSAVPYSAGVMVEGLPASSAVISLPAPGKSGGDLVAFNHGNRSEQKDRKDREQPAEPATDQPFRRSLTLSVFAGPDINGVNNLKNTGRGTSAGIALTYTVLPRLSITAGAAYAKKLYSTDFANYKPRTSYTFPTNPSMVDADCRVLDLPINLNYTVWQKKTNAVGISAGMSSYLMLREDYTYDYDYGSRPGPARYGIRNRNRHYLGVMNFGAEYRKQVGRDLSIGVSPYVKLPVTDIGYGNVKLESAGITTSLNFNLRGIKSDKK